MPEDAEVVRIERYQVTAVWEKQPDGSWKLGCTTARTSPCSMPMSANVKCGVASFPKICGVSCILGEP